MCEKLILKHSNTLRITTLSHLSRISEDNLDVWRTEGVIIQTIGSNAPVLPRSLAFVIAIVVAGIYRVSASHSFFPNPHEWPIYISPILAGMLTTDQCFRLASSELNRPTEDICRKALLAYGILTLIVLFLCTNLTMHHHWITHLCLLYLLFLVFLLWDYYICRHTNADTASKTYVLMGSQYINIPTIITLTLIFSFLLVVRGMSADPLGIIPEVKNNTDADKFAVLPLNYRKDIVLSAFTVGVVSFHTFVASTAYYMLSGRGEWITRYFRKQLIG